MRNCSHKVGSVLALVAFAGIAIARVQGSEEIQVETHTAKIAAKGVHYQFSRSVGPGRLIQANSGQAGVVTKTFRVTYVDHKPVKYELLKAEKSDPKPALYLMGPAGYVPSRGDFVRKRVLTMSSTGYDPSPATIGRGATGFTRTGRRATYGVVAVDPRVIPLNSLVYVEGYGMAIAADTGGAIKGRRIDLCYNSRSQALRHGRRTVRVHLLSPR